MAITEDGKTLTEFINETVEEWIAEITDDTLPGRTVNIGRHDGKWDVQQMYTGMEESYATSVHGADEEFLTALAYAVEAAKEQNNGHTERST